MFAELSATSRAVSGVPVRSLTWLVRFCAERVKRSVLSFLRVPVRTGTVMVQSGVRVGGSAMTRRKGW